MCCASVFPSGICAPSANNYSLSARIKFLDKFSLFNKRFVLFVKIVLNDSGKEASHVLMIQVESGK